MKFPKTLYVKIEKDDEPWFRANSDEDLLAELDPAPIAKYQLVSVHKRKLVAVDSK